MWFETKRNQLRCYERYTELVTGKQKKVSVIVEKKTKQGEK